MEMTITRALAELKLLDARITRKIADTNYVNAKKKSSKKINSTITKEDYDALTKAEYQSINDLIARRKNIKSLIVKSNAETNVVVGGVTLAVADAIERKDSVKYDEMLLSNMERQYKSVVALVNRDNEQVQVKLDALILTTYGKDVKGKDEDIATTTKNFLEINEAEIIDPLEIDKKIKALREQIEDFKMNVDFILSESNSINRITVPD